MPRHVFSCFLQNKKVKKWEPGEWCGRWPRVCVHVHRIVGWLQLARSKQTDLGWGRSSIPGRGRLGCIRTVTALDPSPPGLCLGRLQFRHSSSTLTDACVTGRLRGSCFRHPETRLLAADLFQFNFLPSCGLGCHHADLAGAARPGSACATTLSARRATHRTAAVPACARRTLGVLDQRRWADARRQTRCHRVRCNDVAGQAAQAEQLGQVFSELGLASPLGRRGARAMQHGPGPRPSPRSAAASAGLAGGLSSRRSRARPWRVRAHGRPARRRSPRASVLIKRLGASPYSCAEVLDHHGRPPERYVPDNRRRPSPRTQHTHARAPVQGSGSACA